MVILDAADIVSSEDRLGVFMDNNAQLKQNSAVKIARRRLAVAKIVICKPLM